MRIRVTVVATAVAVFAALPGFAAPASASHTCGLDGSPELNTICENYHSPKPLLQYLVCLVSPNC